MNLRERLVLPGPKRILALDGGGIRGALTTGVLHEIEKVIRQRHNRPDMRLCEYFDLIGGTSTGSIIAACLAVGMEASEISRLYLELGGKVFGSKKIKTWEARFKSKPLVKELRKLFGDITLGGEEIKTGLCIVTKRADTGSIWPLINHPDGAFFEDNRDILLRRAVRASAAAPIFFEPLQLDLGGGQVGTFVDGGVSMANDPSLRLFLVATLRGFPFRWHTGADQLMMISLGTGTWTFSADADRIARSKAWDWAVQVPQMLMADAHWQNQLLLQYLSQSPTATEIDAEVGDLGNDLLGAEPHLSYVRYDVRLEEHSLERLGLGELAGRASSLRQMSEAKNRFDLAKIGERAGAELVKAEHFSRAFDVHDSSDSGRA